MGDAGDTMRTNIEIDDELMAKAMRASGVISLPNPLTPLTHT